MARRGGSRARSVGSHEAEAEPTATDAGASVSEELAAVEPALQRVARQLCDSAAEADDLVQDTYERALRKTDRFDGRNPRGWMVTIMRNLFIDRCRAEARGPGIEPLDAGAVAETPPPPPPPWAGLADGQLRQAVEALPAHYREVYRLRAFEQLSYAAIAGRLEIPIDTVASRLSRARVRLRSLLSTAVGEEGRR